MQNDLKGLVDRPMLPRTQLLDKIVAELSPHLSPIELDMIIDHMNIIATSKWDVNFSVSDASTWISEIIGTERYNRAKQSWTEANQRAIAPFGTKKYRCNKTKQLYDGLDEGDDPNAYEIVYI